MIVKLRKRHLYTWAILAVLLPVIIVLAYINIRSVQTDSFAPKTIDAYAEVVGKNQGEYTLVNLRSENTKHQLEVVILKPIQAANTMVHLTSGGGKKLVLGRLGSKGIYRFDLPASTNVAGGVEVSLYDQIKETEIEKINISL